MTSSPGSNTAPRTVAVRKPSGHAPRYRDHAEQRGVLSELWARAQLVYSYRHFAASLVGKDFKLRYAQSFLGLSWLLIEPLLFVMTLSAVFVAIGRRGPEGVPFPIFFYAGVLPWNLFKGTLTDGSRCFLKDQGLLSKINYPREITVIKELLILLVEFLVGSISFFAIMAIFRFPPNAHWFYLPVLLGLQILFSFGLMLMTSSLTVYIRDVGILMKTVATLWFWFSPVVFDFPMNDMTKPLFILNPMVGIIKSYREIILYDRPPLWEFLAPSFAAGLVLVVAGYVVFRKLERNFVDVL